MDQPAQAGQDFSAAFRGSDHGNGDNARGVAALVALAHAFRQPGVGQHGVGGRA